MGVVILHMWWTIIGEAKLVYLRVSQPWHFKTHGLQLQEFHSPIMLAGKYLDLGLKVAKDGKL